MKSARFYLSWALRKLWATLAVLLVSLAVLLSALRLTLPHLDSNKRLLEDYISDTYGAELTIGRISASWTGKGPAMVLENVRLNSSQAPIRLTIEETEVELDFWASVFNRNIQSKRFHLSQLELALDIDRLEGSDGDYPVVDALQNLFLEQLHRFSVTDSRLLLTSQNKQQVVDLQKLSWLNRGQRHQGVGMMRVSDLTRNSASFILDLQGDSDKLSGTFYANATELDISPWLAQWNPVPRRLNDARVNFTLWADIEPQGVTETQVRFGDSWLQWQDSDRIMLSGGRLDAVPDSEGWRFQLSGMQLASGAAKTPLALDLVGQWSSPGQLRLQSQALDLTAALEVARTLYPDIPEPLPSGQISALRLHSDGSDHLLQAELEDIVIAPTESWPGVGPISAQVNWHNERGHIQIQGDASTLQGEQALGLDLGYRQIRAHAYVDTRSGLSLYMPRLSFDSDLLTLEQSLRYHADVSHLSLVTNIEDMDTTAAKRLFPANLMGQGTSRYLTGSLVDGQVSRAQVIWHGPLQGFPFDDHQGVFQAGLALDEAEFRFAPDWPAVKGLDLDLLFENASMSVTGRRGSIDGIKASRLDARIARLDDSATLELGIDAEATGEQVGRLMNKSGLQASVGKALEALSVRGPLKAEVDIHIPLSGSGVKASGQVTFDDNQLMIRDLNQRLQNLNGTLSFNNDALSASNLTADLWQQPLAIRVQGQQSKRGYKTDIELSGRWQLAELLKPHTTAFAERFEGATDWQGQISLLLPGSGYQYDANFNSDLAGLDITLPEPFAREADEPGQLTAKISGDELVSEVQLKLNDKVTFNGLLPHEEMRFSRAHLALGQTDFVGMGTGFSISANLPKVNMLAWQRAVADLVGEQQSVSDSGVLTPPERIFLFAERLELAGMVLNNADINVKYSDIAWQAAVSAKQSRAQVRLFHDWQQEGIEINADYLRIPRLTDERWSGSSQPQDLPPIRFRCQSCQYRQWELGQVALDLAPVAGGMAIEQLSVKRRQSQLDASGLWLASDSGSRTELEGRLISDDVGKLLKDMNFDSGIRDSGADIRFNVNWQQAPYQFNEASLNGDVKWRLSDGYLTEVSDKGARLFSILSLDSLVRKLTLDFRDVFAKGFFYDEMEGTFTIAEGQVNTDDTVIDGAAGKMQLAGYTDLTTNQLNYDIEFTPKVTSSLPVILAWMANPATAIAAFAIDEVLTSAKVISNIRYSLTGTLEDPILKELERDSREVEIPAQNRSPERSPSTPKSDNKQQKEAENG